MALGFLEVASVRA